MQILFRFQASANFLLNLSSYHKDCEYYQNGSVFFHSHHIVIFLYYGSR
jgi:hypothetical protein